MMGRVGIINLGSEQYSVYIVANILRLCPKIPVPCLERNGFTWLVSGLVPIITGLRTK